jgi:hypothetical protein
MPRLKGKDRLAAKASGGAAVGNGMPFPAAQTTPSSFHAKTVDRIPLQAEPIDMHLDHPA